jgi:hypothetical protein
MSTRGSATERPRAGSVAEAYALWRLDDRGTRSRYVEVTARRQELPDGSFRTKARIVRGFCIRHDPDSIYCEPQKTLVKRVGESFRFDAVSGTASLEIAVHNQTHSVEWTTEQAAPGGYVTEGTCPGQPYGTYGGGTDRPASATGRVFGLRVSTALSDEAYLQSGVNVTPCE